LALLYEGLDTAATKRTLADSTTQVREALQAGDPCVVNSD
jgi:uncharacterized protein YheU (UPF0270 family)